MPGNAMISCGAVSRSVKSGLTKTLQLMLLPATLALALLSLGCGPSEPVPPVSPPAGNYTETINVRFNIADYDHIYYTLDGSVPAENCLEYFGGTFPISSNTELRYIVVTGNEVSGPFSVLYTIEGSGGGGGPAVLANTAYLDAWAASEIAIRQQLADAFFDGCEPVQRCGGQLVLGDFDTYIVCEDGTTSKGNVPAVKASCEANGQGWMTWTVASVNGGGQSLQTYSNYTWPVDVGCDLTIESGQIYGEFDASGSGSTSTANGGSIVTSGCYNGIIDDFVEVHNKQRDGGYYEVSCTDADCGIDSQTGGASIETYLVSPGPTFTLFQQSNNDASCAAPYFLIRNKWNDRCLQASTGSAVGHVLCSNDEAQRWTIELDTSTAAITDDYKLTNVGTGKCLGVNTSNIFGFYIAEVQDCALNNPAQAFRFLGSPEFTRMRNTLAHPDGTYRCLSGDLGQASNTMLAWGTCGTQDWFMFTFLPDGTFPAVYPPNVIQ